MVSNEGAPFLELARGLKDRQTDFQLTFLAESSALLGENLRELALREAGLQESHPITEAVLLQAATDIVAVMGLDRYVTVHESRQETPIEIGERIYAARKEAKLSQTKFGELLGLSRFTVLRIEKGQVQITKEQMAQINKLIGSLESPSVTLD